MIKQLRQFTAQASNLSIYVDSGDIMSINILLDFIIVAIFVLCVIEGMRKGLVKSVYRIFAFVLSIILSVVLLQPFTQLLSQTSIASSIRDNITQSIMNTEDGGSMDDILPELHLPLFLQDSISNQYRMETDQDMQNQQQEQSDADAQHTDLSEWIANVLTNKIISVLGAVLLFIGIRILLGLIFYMLNALFHLPLLNSINKILGAFLGLINGAIIVYGLCAVLTLLSSHDFAAPIMNAVESSLIARCFYEYNILLNLLTINSLF